jgi:hypothetical protein
MAGATIKLICTVALWVNPQAAHRYFFVCTRKIAQKYTSLPAVIQWRIVDDRNRNQIFSERLGISVSEMAMRPDAAARACRAAPPATLAVGGRVI